MNYKVTVNPIASILGILSIIANWKIFEDHGEKGWKALIPFYSTYIFGKICNDVDDAKKVIIWIVVLLAATIGLSIGLAGSVGMLAVVFGALVLVSLILAVYYTYKLYRVFDTVNGGPSWMIILWIMLPSFAAIYYAFIQNNYDIPGVSKKNNTQDKDNTPKNED